MEVATLVDNLLDDILANNYTEIVTTIDDHLLARVAFITEIAQNLSTKEEKVDLQLPPWVKFAAVFRTGGITEIIDSKLTF